MKTKTITIVTGTPGTGKTTIAKKIAKKTKAVYIDVNAIIKKHKLSDNYDSKRKAKIVDTKKLNTVLINIIKTAKTPLIIDSHLSHYVPSKYVTCCIVTKTSLNKLRDRLKKRQYINAKIEENMIETIK